eukprot:TRINITY_DN36130_c0_g1_i1.p1 TRINITY_DN36130_c0_g1~~TRINITY_DN36130_c0_g1_i1.p1  ORF type:complete len:358 (-),score=55.11 TRINITY_DN36130_c0_g1_i1:470-1483(-)
MPPDYIKFKGKEIECYTFKNLESTSVRVIKDRALRLREKLKDEDWIPDMPNGAEHLIRWMLELQAVLARKQGMTEVTAQDYGLPLMSRASQEEDRRQRWQQFLLEQKIATAVEDKTRSLSDSRSSMSTDVSETEAAPGSPSSSPIQSSLPSPKRPVAILSIQQAAAWDGDILKSLAKWETEAFGGRSIEERLRTFQALAIGQDDPTHWGFLQVFIAMDCDNGEALGSAALVADDIGWKRLEHGFTPWLSSVFVKHSARRRGLGRHLVEKVAEEALRRGFSELYLYHCPDILNDAGKIDSKLTPMYERWGFQKTVLHKQLKCPNIIVMKRALKDGDAL